MIILAIFLVGIIFLVGNAVLVRQRQIDQRAKIVTGEDPSSTEDTDNTNAQVVYRYLPRDLDEYYRGDVNVPSKLYSPMFTQNDDALRIR